MKIAYVLNTYPQPSHSFIRREIRALEAAGHSVKRFAMRPSESTLVDIQDQEEATQTEYVLAAGMATLGKAMLRQLASTPGAFVKAAGLAWRCGARSEVGRIKHMIYLGEACHVLQRCAAEDVSHVHAHFGTNAAAVAMLSRVMGGPKYSFTVHGPEEFDSPRALSLCDKIAHSDFTVAISQFGRSQLCRWAEFDDWERIKTVHCGIEPSHFPEATALPQGPLRLVSIGRFVEQKGQLALVKAMAQLKEADVHLTLIGDGEMRGEIETLMKTHGLGDKITLTGWVDEKRIAAELAAAHGLVMPSFAEGLPMVVMEAMAAARPVIATYIAGTPELVLEGETGWLVPAGDVEALVAAILKMSKTPHQKLTQMGQTARTRVFERHDVTKEAAKLAGFIAG